jgi:hypothetical protein
MIEDEVKRMLEVQKEKWDAKLTSYQNLSQNLVHSFKDGNIKAKAFKDDDPVDGSFVRRVPS